MIKNKALKLTMTIIILIYIISYYVANSGYYEYHLQERTYLTNQKIKEFEEDVKNNENIDVKDYLAYEKVEYTNKFTNLMYQISSKGNNVARKIIKTVFRKLRYLVED